VFVHIWVFAFHTAARLIGVSLVAVWVDIVSTSVTDRLKAFAIFTLLHITLFLLLILSGGRR
jgi:hypothetical protein